MGGTMGKQQQQQGLKFKQQRYIAPKKRATPKSSILENDSSSISSSIAGSSASSSTAASSSAASSTASSSASATTRGNVTKGVTNWATKGDGGKMKQTGGKKPGISPGTKFGKGGGGNKMSPGKYPQIYDQKYKALGNKQQQPSPAQPQQQAQFPKQPNPSSNVTQCSTEVSKYFLNAKDINPKEALLLVPKSSGQNNNNNINTDAFINPFGGGNVWNYPIPGRVMLGDGTYAYHKEFYHEELASPQQPPPTPMKPVPVSPQFIPPYAFMLDNGKIVQNFGSNGGSGGSGVGGEYYMNKKEQLFIPGKHEMIKWEQMVDGGGGQKKYQLYVDVMKKVADNPPPLPVPSPGIPMIPVIPIMPPAPSPPPPPEEGNSGGGGGGGGGGGKVASSYLFYEKYAATGMPTTTTPVDGTPTNFNFVPLSSQPPPPITPYQLVLPSTQDYYAQLNSSHTQELVRNYFQQKMQAQIQAQMSPPPPIPQQQQVPRSPATAVKNIVQESQYWNLPLSPPSSSSNYGGSGGGGQYLLHSAFVKKMVPETTGSPVQEFSQPQPPPPLGPPSYGNSLAPPPQYQQQQYQTLSPPPQPPPPSPPPPSSNNNNSIQTDVQKNVQDNAITTIPKKLNRQVTLEHLDSIRRELRDIRASIGTQKTSEMLTKMDELIENFRRMKQLYLVTIKQLTKDDSNYSNYSNYYSNLSSSPGSSMVGQSNSYAGSSFDGGGGGRYQPQHKQSQRQRQLAKHLNSQFDYINSKLSVISNEVLHSVKMEEMNFNKTRKTPSTRSPSPSIGKTQGNDEKMVKSKNQHSVTIQDMQQLNRQMERLMHALFTLKDSYNIDLFKSLAINNNNNNNNNKSSQVSQQSKQQPQVQQQPMTKDHSNGGGSSGIDSNKVLSPPLWRNDHHLPSSALLSSSLSSFTSTITTANNKQPTALFPSSQIINNNTNNNNNNVGGSKGYFSTASNTSMGGGGGGGKVGGKGGGNSK